MGQNNDRIAVILTLPPMNPQNEALARFQTLPITLVTWQIHGMGCGPHRRNDAVRAGKVQVIGTPGAEIRDANRGSGLIPVPFVAHGNNHVETSGHEPRMGTVEIFERHRNHRGYHAACDKPADVNSHNTHPNRKEENQCSSSLSQ